MTITKGQRWLCLFFLPCKSAKIYGGLWQYKSQWNLEFHIHGKNENFYFKEQINKTSQINHLTLKDAKRLVHHIGRHFLIQSECEILPIYGDHLSAFLALQELPIENEHDYPLSVLN